MQTPITEEQLQARVDADQLQQLVLLMRIYGVLGILCSSPFLMHVWVGLETMTNPNFFGGQGQRPPPFAGGMFVIGGLLIVGAGWTIGILSLYAAKCVEARKNWGWVMGSACVNCIQMPLGTALGIFTIIVINRPSVRDLFGAPLRP